jgi:hypothetical protein
MRPSTSNIQAAGGTHPFPLFAFLFFLQLGFPSLSFAHGYDFLSARLDLLNGGSLLELTITAEYGGNPMLPDIAKATQAMQEVLHIESRGQAHRLSDLAPLTLHQTTQQEGMLPPSIAHAEDGQDHQFLQAHWRWVPDASEVAFSVPKPSLHDVLLWRLLPTGETQSMLLLSGDVSKPIPVHSPQRPSLLLVWLLVAMLLIFSLVQRRRSLLPTSH